MKNYKQKMCKIHNFRFAGFLKDCPICVGEKMSAATPPKEKPISKEKPIPKEKPKKRKLSLWK